MRFASTRVRLALENLIPEVCWRVWIRGILLPRFFFRLLLFISVRENHGCGLLFAC